MANESYIQYKLTSVRVTKLNSCGVPDSSSCSYFVDECVVSVEDTAEYKDREEWFFENGDGNFCATVTTPPKLKWRNLVLTFNDTNPQLANFLTGNPIVLDNDDTTTPNKIGFDEVFDSASVANFALEGWTRIAATCDDLDGCTDDGAVLYGKVLYPFVKEGTLGDFTMQNDLANFVVNAIAVRNSPWGVGPYNVYVSEATATLGQPVPEFSAVPTTAFKRMTRTELPPPNADCDCQDITPSLTFADSGVLMGTVTFPLRGGVPILPAIISWGDAMTTTVTSGTTAQHTYGAPGSYAPTYRPTQESAPTYVAASTPIA